MEHDQNAVWEGVGQYNCLPKVPAHPLLPIHPAAAAVVGAADNITRTPMPTAPMSIKTQATLTVVVAILLAAVQRDRVLAA